jgi:hypothetical protein
MDSASVSFHFGDNKGKKNSRRKIKLLNQTNIYCKLSIFHAKYARTESQSFKIDPSQRILKFFLIFFLYFLDKGNGLLKTIWKGTMVRAHKTKHPLTKQSAT